MPNHPKDADRNSKFVGIFLPPRIRHLGELSGVLGKVKRLEEAEVLKIATVYDIMSASQVHQGTSKGICKHHGRLCRFLPANVSPDYLLEGLWHQSWRPWITESRVTNDVEENHQYERFLLGIWLFTFAAEWCGTGEITICPRRQVDQGR